MQIIALKTSIKITLFHKSKQYFKLYINEITKTPYITKFTTPRNFKINCNMETASGSTACALYWKIKCLFQVLN